MPKWMRCKYCGTLQDEPKGAKICSQCGGELASVEADPWVKETSSCPLLRAQLETLDLIDSQQLTGLGLLPLAQLKRLTALWLRDSPPGLESAPEVQVLQRALPRCRIEFYPGSRWPSSGIIPPPVPYVP